MINFGIIAFLKYLNLKLVRETRIEKVNLPRISYPFYLRTQTSDISAFRQIFSHKEFGIKFQFLPKNIIDAGGYIGLAAIYFANRFPNAQIVSIEPEKSNFDLLKRNVSFYKNINPLKKALSNLSNQVLNIVDKGYGEWGSVTISEENSQEEKIIDAVKTITVEEIMRENDFEHIDILKMDIEGTEKEVFESGFDYWLPKTRCLIIELHDDIKKDASKNVLAAIKKYDFRQFKKGENLVFINKDKKFFEGFNI